MNQIIDILFILGGYLFGGILFAELYTKCICKKSLIAISHNHNPGTSNAFIYGGFWCGTLTLLCDLAKAALPIFLYLLYYGSTNRFLFFFVMLAPVLGHGYSLYHRFYGGMCITCSFGVFIGLSICNWKPLGILIVLYLLSLLIPRIDNSVRTIIVYAIFSIVSGCLLIFSYIDIPTLLGCIGISIIVILRMRVDIARQSQTNPS